MMNNDLPAWTRRLGPWQLQTLLEIARSGSISGAASRMATTQPGLSKWLKDLEEALGVVLFERTTRRLTPTPYGEIVLRLAEQIVGDTLRMHDEIRALQAGRLGQVKLGMLPFSVTGRAGPVRDVAAVLEKATCRQAVPIPA